MKKYLPISILAIMILILSFSLYLPIHLRSRRSFEIFRARVLDNKPEFLDYPTYYKLDNGIKVMANCGECFYVFKGKVIGDPVPGDLVEVKANKVYFGDSDPKTDPDYYIYETGSYIKKL